jgi:pyrimidine and pyridine-specific 5'-nucleotidase
LQIFTNSDKVHAEEVLLRLGLEDCFEGVICFETLNPPAAPSNGLCHSQEDYVALSREPASDLDYLNGSYAIPKSPILCKPTTQSMEAAIRIANVDPRKTV